MLREKLAELLDKQPRKSEIQRAVNLQNKVRFFTEPVESSLIDVPYKTDYLKLVSDRLDNFDSYNRFVKNTSYPFKINGFIDDIYTRLAKIWQGQNPYYTFEFKPEKDDYHDLTNIHWFKNEVFEQFKSNYNSIILTDLPSDEDEEKEPHNIFVNIDTVIDVKSKNNEIKHLIYKLTDDKIAVIDEETWDIWNYKDNTLGLEAEKSEPHNLDRCPAVWLSQLDFNSSSNIIKSNPLCKSIGKIEDLQIIYTLKNILSPYAFFQFIVKFKNDSACNYDNGSHYCDGGYLRRREDNSSVTVGTSNALARCPQCNKAPGVGDVISKPIPTSSDEPQLNNVIEFVAPGTQIMEYGDKYILNLENDLFNNIMGSDDILNPNQNHNELAYKYNVEGEQSTIIKWKTMFENTISLVLDNTLELVYGDAYKGNVINLGTDFILAKLDNLYSEKERLDKLGLTTEFDFNKTIINAKFNENPERKRRALIINDFKPFDEPIDKIELSAKDGLIDKKDFIKQKYLNEFIRHFESKKVPLNSFSLDLPIDKIVDIMNTEFDTWYNNKFNQNKTI